MGNRAVIAFKLVPTKKTPVVYLHWNGGKASVEGFLAAAKELGIKDIKTFGDMILECLGSSVYHETWETADRDNHDNGTYIVDPDTLEIAQRLFMNGPEEVNPEKTEQIRQSALEKWRARLARVDDSKEGSF